MRRRRDMAHLTAYRIDRQLCGLAELANAMPVRQHHAAVLRGLTVVKLQRPVRPGLRQRRHLAAILHLQAERLCQGDDRRGKLCRA